MLVNGICGPEARAAYEEMFSGLAVDLSGMVSGSGQTFTWHAVHDFERWRTSAESADPGCDPEWAAELSPGSRTAPALLVASLDPAKQLRALEQSSAALVAGDSMTAFIDGARDAVVDVAQRCDVFFLDARELQHLTGGDDWRSAAASLCGRGRLRAVVVKRGPLGAACVTTSGISERAARPVAEVVDPTGAGDALAGGFLGHCATLEDGSIDVFPAALDAGMGAAAAAITSFGVDDLLVAARREGRSARQSG